MHFYRNHRKYWVMCLRSVNISGGSPDCCSKPFTAAGCHLSKVEKNGSEKSWNKFCITREHFSPHCEGRSVSKYGGVPTWLFLQAPCQLGKHGGASSAFYLSCSSVGFKMLLKCWLGKEQLTTKTVEQTGGRNLSKPYLWELGNCSIASAKDQLSFKCGQIWRRSRVVAPLACHVMDEWMGALTRWHPKATA